MESLKGRSEFHTVDFLRSCAGLQLGGGLFVVCHLSARLQTTCDWAAYIYIYINGTIGCFGFEGYGMGQVKKLDALLL